MLLNCVKNELAAATQRDSHEHRRMENNMKILGELIRDDLMALPNGDEYCRTMETILERERNWAEWKRDGCKDSAFKEKLIDLPILRANPGCEGVSDLPEKGISKGRGKRPRPSQDWAIKLGSEDLNRIWNTTESNDDALVNIEAAAPEVSEFLEVMHRQAHDPTVEDSERLYNDEIFQWKALRLLSRSGISWPTEMTLQAAVESGFGSLDAPREGAGSDGGEIKGK